MSNFQLPYNLSLQFSLIQQETPNSSVKKAPKTRNKKVKEKQEYDILQIDEQIKTCFTIEKAKIPEYKKRVESMVIRIANLSIPFGVNDDTINDIKSIIKHVKTGKTESPNIKPVMTYREFLEFYGQLKRLMVKIENIESDSLYNKYISLTSSIIEEYRKILAIPIKIAFLSKSYTKSDNQDKKNTLLDSYLKIASNFIDIEYIQESSVPTGTKQVCSNCGNSAEFESREGYTTCENCGFETPIVMAQTTFKDQERINMHQKYRYEKSSHFREAIYQFQGNRISILIRRFILKQMNG